MRLDRRPKFWEERVAIYCAYLVENGSKSATVKSYVSGIKCLLKLNGYKYDDNKVLLNSLTRACRLINDKIYHRLPIKKSLLEMLLFKLERMCSKSVYMESLYKAIFTMAYYGLMCASELATESYDYCMDHAIRACNIHVGVNKSKIMLVLYSSKTHGVESRLQRIKITGTKGYLMGTSLDKRHFCPFTIINEYMAIRGNYNDDDEHFFIFRGGIKVTQTHIRKILKSALNRMNLNSGAYDLHSFRIGRTMDLFRAGHLIDYVKHTGRWKSNAVYKYIKM